MNIQNFETGKPDLILTIKSTKEINKHLESLFSYLKIDFKIEDIEVRIKNFTVENFQIDCNEVSILNLKTNNFIDIFQIYKDFGIDFKTIYRADNWEDYFVMYIKNLDEDLEEIERREDEEDFDEDEDDIYSSYENYFDHYEEKIESIDRENLENEIFVSFVDSDKTWKG